MRITLGFDTSCYTTSAAAVNEHGEVVASFRMLLPVAEGERGLRQSEAVFVHVRQMPLVMEKLRLQLADKDAKIVSVCASAFPRDEKESYMPVFTVGLGHAKVLASALNVPLHATSHQQGHIAAGLVGAPQIPDHFAALHLSGGTTELLECKEGKLRLIGGSRDLHAGQMVDRVGVALGLRFPAGPALEKLALACTEKTEAVLPLSMECGDLYCHLSGAETRARQLIAKGAYSPERIAAEVFDLLGRTVARLLAGACKSCGTKQALVVGGVASSTLLRTLTEGRLCKLRAPVKVLYGKPEYSADNAVGVASIGMQKYLQTIQNA